MFLPVFRDKMIFFFFSIVHMCNLSISVGIVLNSLVLVIAGKQSTRPDIRSRTNVHYIVFHLTIADTITCFITMPMETLWRLTIEVK